MYISSFSIENYKSYSQTGEIELKPGFNLIVGKNNVGKTSLLEILSNSYINNPHRSLTTTPLAGQNINNVSKIDIRIRIKKAKFVEWLFYGNENEFKIPKIFVDNNRLDDHNILAILNDKLISDYVNFSYLAALSSLYELGVTGFVADDLQDTYLSCSFDKSEMKFNHLRTMTIPGLRVQSLWYKIASIFISKIYYFKAERYNLGECKGGDNVVLKPNSENLPEVLSKLQTNPSKFDRFNKYLNIIFPQIYRVTVNPKADNFVQILTWTTDPDSERIDLAIPLNESGTGVGQVLAMLYVMLSKEPMIIIIDELQSFLHPGAARKLIEIFKEDDNKHHQYIIATHSPTVISAANPDTITMIQHEGTESKLIPIDINAPIELNSFLNEVGARLSDVFGADNILWVEGATEERCIPLIIKKVMRRSLIGTTVLGVINTGDLEGKDKNRIYRIYKKLSKSNSLMPPSIGFIFDREGKTDEDIQTLESEPESKVKFLPRRMFENYLLNNNAILFVISTIEKFSEEVITLENINEWVEKNKADSKYWKGNIKYSESDWKKGIHGAEFLKNLFLHLSVKKVSFNKTTHSILLNDWIIENSPADFDDICKILEIQLC